MAEPAPGGAAPFADLAGRVTDVLRHAPILKQAPNVALTIAKTPGDVRANAEGVAAIAHVRALDLAAQRRMAEIHVARGAAVGRAGGVLPGERPGTTITGEAAGVARAATHAVSDIGRYAKGNISTAPAPEAAAHVLTGQGLNPAPAISAAAAGQPAPQAFGAATVKANLEPAVQQAVTPIVNQLNPISLMTTPQHLYRTWMDIYDTHGPAAMIEAMAPSIVGAGLGYFAARGGGAEEGAALAEDVTGTAPAAPLTEAASTAQTVGRGFRAFSKAVAKPITVPVGGVLKAGSAIGTSPAFLGANVAGIGTQFTDPIFKQSWDRTQNGMPRGEIGSIGRAIATGLHNIGIPGFEPGSNAYKAISGSLDAFTNIAILDPLGAAGRVVGQARSAEGLGGPLGKIYPGMAIRTPEDVDRVIKQYPGAQNFVDYAASHTGTEILHTFGEFKVPPLLAQKLGNAHTEEGVVNVLKDMATATEFTDRVLTMPTLGRYGKLRSELGEMKLAGKLAGKLTTPVPSGFQQELGKFSGREFTMGDRFAVRPLMDWMHAAGMPKDVSDYYGAQLLETADPAKWANTLTKSAAWVIDNEVKKAIGHDNPLSNELQGIIEKNSRQVFGGQGAGKEGVMASDYTGKDLSTVRTIDDEGKFEDRVGALWFTQQGRAVMPQVRDVQKVAKELAGVVNWSSAKGVYAKGQNMRDTLDDWVNHKFFQPMALATGGWSLRVSSSEMLLNMLRLGPLNYSAAAIARSLTKHDLALGLIHTDPAALADMDRLDQLVQKGIKSSEAKSYMARAGQNLTRNAIAAVRGVLAGAEEGMLEGIGRQRFLDAATKLILLHDGFMIPGGVNAIHNAMTVGQDEVSRAYGDIVEHEDKFGNHERDFKNAELAQQYSGLYPWESGYFGALSSHHGLITLDHTLGRPLAQFMYEGFQSGLNEEQVTARAVNKAYTLLTEADPEQVSYMMRSVGYNPDHLNSLDVISPLHSWAQDAVAGLLGAVKGQYGVLHMNMLEDIAKGTVPQTAKDMYAKYRDIPEADLPKQVPGRRPSLGSGTALQRAASWLHTNYLGKIVNYLSREPTFVADFANELKLLEPQLKAGMITSDQADVLAQTRAIFKSIRFIHNPQDRMVVEQTLHIVAPFWFAKNQAIRRAGRLFAQNPGAFEQYLKINLAVQNMGYHANQGGQNYVVFPGSGVVGTVATGGIAAASHVPMFKGILGDSPVGSIPIGLSGSTDTLQSVVPWSGNGEAAPGSPLSLEQTLTSPSLGPLGAIPVRVLDNFLSGHARAFGDQVLGPVGSTAAPWTYLLPNSILQHLAESLATAAGTNDLGTSGNSAVLTAIAAMAEKEGPSLKLNQVLPSDWSGTPGSPNVPPPAGGNIANNAWNRAQLLKRAKAYAVTMLLMRTLVSANSPVSVTLNRADLKFSKQFQNYLQDKKYKGDALAATDAFMRDHPDAVPSTVAQSVSDAGAGWGETAKDGQWIQEHLALVHKYPDAAQYLIPPRDDKGPFSEATHLMQISEDLRHEQTPQDFVKAILTAWGNSWLYNGVMPQFDQALKANPGNSYQLYKQLDTVTANYGKRNPVWYESYNAKAPTQQRTESFQHLQEMLKDPATPKNQQTAHLQYLVDDYTQYYQGAKANAGSAVARATLKTQWQQYLQEKAKEWPDVSVAVTDLFLHLS